MVERDSPAGFEDSSEMRASGRMALSMELRFSYRRGGVTYLGTGRTRNLNGDSLCFETDQDFQSRSGIELCIPWPSPLQSVCPLELIVHGALVRRDAATAVIRMTDYRFQTCGERSFTQFSSRGITCNIAA